MFKIANQISHSALAITLPICLLTSALHGQGITFPDDAGVIDVRDFGAIPNDGIDDWAAIQAAMDSVSFNSRGVANASGSNNHIIYFPDGRYDLADMLVYPGQQKRLILQGQSRDGVELRLFDGLGWSSQDSKAILRTGSGTADRFRNAVRDMTFNIGSNNSHASGLQFFASNQGTVKNVRIKSEDGLGVAGLDMAWDDAIGPLLIEDVTIEGFDVGVDTRWQTASQTFENLTVRNQNLYGFRNRNNQAVFIHGFTSEQQSNSVIAAANLSNSTEAMVITDAILRASGGNSGNPAIQTQRNLFVADVAIDGYAKAIDNNISGSRGNKDLVTDYVEEYFAIGEGGPNKSGPALTAFPSPNRSLRLLVKDAPDVPWEQDQSKWAGPQDFGGNADDNIDDTAALQAAIDSGATTVYLPNGKWTLNGTLHLRGNVERFLGTEARLVSSNGQGLILVQDGESEAIVIERMESGLRNSSVELQQNTNRTLILNSLQNFTYRTNPTVSEPGELFINDYVGELGVLRDQTVWARQLNVEKETEQDPGEPEPSQPARIINDGGRVWLNGVKTEQDGTVVLTINGGETELLGHFHAGSGSTQTDPRFETIDSSFSAAVWVDQAGGSGRFDVFARETRNGVTRIINPSRPGPFPNLYTAFAFTESIDKPELHLSADGDALDSSGFGHVTQPDPTLSYTEGIAGASTEEAFYFDGSTAIDLTTGVLQQPLSERTISLWIKPDDTTGLYTIYDEGGADAGLAITISSGILVAGGTNGDSITVVTAVAPVSDMWSHIALIFEHGQLRLYVNGVLADSQTATFTTIPWRMDDRSSLGSTLDSNAIATDLFGGFDGAIDELRIWGVALDDAQIFELSRVIPEPSTIVLLVIPTLMSRRRTSFKEGSKEAAY
ncbi:glycosyl hydrolase family 28-related protein [Mucisphaera sp.]|uniref:glycosyl hydrolase family 28-related protein n=1 Tax=Mucisphaera sp. TaxID=2913024 RepID=UPI003D10AD01